MAAGLAERIRAGNRAAFEQMVRAHYPRPVEFATAMTGSRNAADDVIQDVSMTIPVGGLGER